MQAQRWAAQFAAANSMPRIFLGPDAACKADPPVNQSAPAASAASLYFPAAAAANRSVFFHSGGAPKSVREVYDWAMQQPGGSAATAPAVTPAPATDTSTPLLRAANDCRRQQYRRVPCWRAS